MTLQALQQQMLAFLMRDCFFLPMFLWNM
jgi:hypothetical protein